MRIAYAEPFSLFSVVGDEATHVFAVACLSGLGHTRVGGRHPERAILRIGNDGIPKMAHDIEVKPNFDMPGFQSAYVCIEQSFAPCRRVGGRVQLKEPESQ